MSNLPENPEEIVDIISNSQILKINTELGEIKLEAHNQINIQPKGTPLGMKLKVEETGDIIPTITFDTKKLQQPKKEIDAKQMLDDAIRDYLNGQEI
jgi:hypothetical protein